MRSPRQTPSDAVPANQGWRVGVAKTIHQKRKGDPAVFFDGYVTACSCCTGGRDGGNQRCTLRQYRPVSADPDRKGNDKA